MTAGGVWTYTLDNSNAAVQALNAGQTLTDTFTVTTVDGTAAADHHHHQWRQRRGGDQRDITGDGVEAGGVANGTPGTPTAIGDLDADRRRQSARALDAPSCTATAGTTATAPTR